MPVKVMYIVGIGLIMMSLPARVESLYLPLAAGVAFGFIILTYAAWKVFPKSILPWLFALCVLVFNPFLPQDLMSQENWAMLHGFAGCALLFYAFNLEMRMKNDKSDRS